MDAVDLLSLAVAAVAAVLAALLTVADALLTGVSRFRAQTLVDEDRPGAAALAHLLERRESRVQRVLFARLGCMALAVGGPVYALRDLGTGPLVLTVVVVVLVMHMLTVAIPRVWALRRLDSALTLGPAVTRVVGGLPPVRWPADGCRKLARRLVPGGRSPEPLVLPGLDDLDGDASEDAIRYEADPAPQQGFDANELLASVVEFTRTVVREIMVPRTDMVTLSADLTVAEATSRVDVERYSRFPVEGEGVDDIVGIAYIKDLMRAALRGDGERRVRDLMHPARFVPETKRASALLQEMQLGKVHLALVVDEYGGTAGLISLEDVLEELVGEITDEFDEDLPPPVERLDDGRFRLSASALVADVNDDLDEPLPEGDWDTVGGLVFDVFGRVPLAGEVVELEGRSLEVERIVGRRIATVLVSPAPVPQPANGKDEP